MALKFRVKSREEVPAEHQALYVERDGGFVLDALSGQGSATAHVN